MPSSTTPLRPPLRPSELSSTSFSNIPSTVPSSTHLPRLLCLHGGGVNAAIFKAQSRSLIRHLEHSFRLIWADAPFFCDPHVDVIHVYGSYGPFRRWVRWLPEHAEIDAETCIEEIGYAIRTAMEDDDRAGGRGEWVGLMGFSQGAGLSASLLLEQQAREELSKREGRKDIGVGPTGIKGLNWRFGILLAGRAPLSNLNPELLTSRALASVADASEGFQFCDVEDDEAILKKKTLHVHGLADPGLQRHRLLLNDYCEEESATLVEWDGAHRVPLKSKDVNRVMEAVYDIAEKTGVKVTRTV